MDWNGRGDFGEILPSGFDLARLQGGETSAVHRRGMLDQDFRAITATRSSAGRGRTRRDRV